MYGREEICALNAEVIAADPCQDGDYEIVFEEPDSEEDLARLEALIGVAVPPALRHLYLKAGVFRHVSYGGMGYTIDIPSVRKQLEWLTGERNRQLAYPHSMGLVANIHSDWGGRPEFDELGDWFAQTVDANYFVFGQRYIDDNVHDYLYFERDGMFGNLLFDQDQTSHNVYRMQTLAEILPEPEAGLDPGQRRAFMLAEAASYDYENTFPRGSLEQILQAQFENSAMRLLED